MPEKVLKGWYAERDDWLRRHALAGPNWRAKLANAEPELQDEFHRRFSSRWENHLDSCHGDCVLRRPELAAIVGKSLQHFNGDRYVLTDFVVMPNHVHLLAAFATEEAMLEQCESWKHFTATQINRTLGTKGRFWQQDGFDHLVRSDYQFDALQRYIAENPQRANLNVGEHLHYSIRGLYELWPSRSA
jgi:type I restriction enzyme R subunit